MAKLLVLLTFLISSCTAFQNTRPLQWEHGWKTERVVATRYQNPVMGWNIGFTFPKSPYNSDRAEISDFLESEKGSVYQGGGYLGAPMYATFTDVNSRETADKKLVTILPALDKLMRDIDAGVKIPKPAPRKILDKGGKEWPECVPPDPTQPFSEFNNNLTVNGTPYKCSSQGRWVINQEIVAYKNQMAIERNELLVALTSRKLNHNELMRLSPFINLQEMVPYSACNKYAELYDMLVRQWELQTEQKLPFYNPLSRALGEYNRCPQEEGSKRSVTQLIEKLQTLNGLKNK